MIDRLFDVVICVLLVTTIAHLALVQRRLRAFRAERDRLQAFVTALDLTVERAEAAIRRMRNVEAQRPPAASEAPRAVRQRTPEDLLRTARAAAGVGGKAAPGASAKGAKPRSAETLADALHHAIGS